MSIANLGKDERGKYIGGKAGDQTGKEYAIIPWYNRPFNVILRYPNKDVARDIALLSRESALNDHIGYDQGNRLSFYNKLKNTVNWNPANIIEDVEADCSSSTAAILIAVGNRLKIQKLRDLSPALTTKNMRKALVAAGFTAFVDGVYTTSDKFLLPGDILLCVNHHVAVNLDKGAGDPSLVTIANEVINGLFGTGKQRRDTLSELGYDAVRVQAEVNLLLW